MASYATTHLEPALSPEGRLHLRASPRAAPLRPDLAARLEAAFATGAPRGLLHMGAAEVATALPQPWAWWRDVAALLPTAICRRPADEHTSTELPAPRAELTTAILRAPPMHGGEYLDLEVLGSLWRGMVDALNTLAPDGPQRWLAEQHSGWHTVGRIHLHLAEHKADPSRPFAFMATYTTRLSAAARPQHLPLGRAVQQAAATRDRAELLALLEPVQRACKHSEWLAELVDAGGLYRPCRWTARQAFAFLQEVPTLEKAGVSVRMPANWKGRSPARARVTATIGEASRTAIGRDALLDFQLHLSVGDETLSHEEMEALLAGVDGLQWIRGRWVEVDREQLGRMLAHYEQVQALADHDGLDFQAALKLLVGGPMQGDPSADAPDPEWSRVVAGKELARTLEELRSPTRARARDLAAAGLRASLRPYQQEGVGWLLLLSRLGLGACLADDMGLGKTVQVLALLVALKAEAQGGGRGSLPAQGHFDLRRSGRRDGRGPARRRPPEGRLQAAPRSLRSAESQQRSGRAGLARARSDRDTGHACKGPALVVVPASLLGNWQAEAARFAPDLRLRVAHRSATDGTALPGRTPADLAGIDLVLTTYATLTRDDGLRALRWRLCVLDEAQAIKNPGTRQTRAAKEVRADARIAMTGTPVENRLADLWSLMDFLNPGLLGSAKAFERHVKRMADAPDGYAPLRRLVQPYLLRRRKTDKAVIADLPDKTEVRAFCGLSRLQASLYAQAVQALAEQLETAAGMARRGLILASLMRLKQICNHPSQWLGDGSWQPANSGKFQRLGEMAGTVAARGEKMLVFTQFRETIAPLQAFLQGVFGTEGLVLHGGTPVRRRTERVQRFAEDPGVGFFILSLKAGGTGLNLTAASHVVHFDRWWNPAVEDQATDRAFRIGQKRNVLVHKLVCRGTVEERIDRLIADKRQLSDEVLGGDGEALLTELSDADLIATVALDIEAALVPES